MNNYQDQYSRWHDKTTGSNNGFIYSSYSKYLAPNTLDYHKLQLCYEVCKRSDSPLKIDRSPNDQLPPFSKDELIGCVSLGLLRASEIQASHWNFCNLDYKPEKLTLVKFIKAAKILYSIRNEHRNYVWQNSLTDAYCLSFYTPFEVQYYINRYSGEPTTLVQTIVFYVNALLTIVKGDESSRMLLWLQCKDMNHWLGRFLPTEKYVTNYFEKDHTFVKNLLTSK